ncbi:hypothetical protein ISN45_Aa05g012160 [Arabidopsis thaliana x Arabidopsis arenosa]|uniref:Transmembrane protein n=1 Tax=Arabidopsis thaliana x Arabidopsis arenosa TaxID=1240361 RepID=A0A8T1ZN80_9BRAS|nr:hypothetical protein ISN45_Aa05g012160 [Arabidopsis thaliana x Arabidopsis arenosa]
MDYETLEIEDPNDLNIPVDDNYLVEPGWAALFSLLAVFAILSSIDNIGLCQANFSIQSISVSSSSSESVWTVYFLVNKPSFRCSISYEREYVSANLGSLKIAIVNVSHNQLSNGHTDFSVVFAAKTEDIGPANRSDVFSSVHNLNIKLLVKRKQLASNNKPGHFNVQCRNLTVVFSSDMKSGAMLGDKKIECHSSFLNLIEIFP